MPTRPWTGLQEPSDRVAWAREQRFRSAAEAARALGMKEGTYRAYERRPDASKATKLDYEAARLFARRFGVNWAWLLTGADAPFDPDKDAEDAAEIMSVVARLNPDQRRQLLEIAKTFLHSGGNDPTSFAASENTVHEPGVAWRAAT